MNAIIPGRVSGLLAEPVIGPRDFARVRWLGPGMTSRKEFP